MRFSGKKVLAFLMVLVLMMTVVSVSMADSLIDTIMSAGTTQSFSDEAVPVEDLQTILQAGLSTTSAINQQPWFFVAVTNKEVMSQLTSGSGAPAGMPAGATPPEGAPVGVDKPAMPASNGPKAALGDSPAAIIVYMDGNTKSPNAAFDCGLASQNMYIAAAALGYGVKIVSSPTMTLNGANHDTLCQLLGVDTSMQAVAVLLIGKVNTDATSSPSVRNTLTEKTNIIQ